MRPSIAICWTMLFSATVPAQDLDFARIDQRIADWQPTRAERRFDDIGWAPRIPQVDALVAELSKRP